MKTKFIVSGKKITNAQANTQFPIYFIVKEGSDKVAKLVPLEDTVNMPKPPFRKIAIIDTANLSLKIETYTNKEDVIKNRTVAFIEPSKIEWLSEEDSVRELAEANERKAEELL